MENAPGRILGKPNVNHRHLIIVIICLWCERITCMLAACLNNVAIIDHGSGPQMIRSKSRSGGLLTN